LRALYRLLRGVTIGRSTLQRSAFRALLRFEPCLRETQSFALGFDAALGLRFLLELGRFARLCGGECARIGFGTRGRRGFGGAVRFKARRGLLRERCFGAHALLRPFERLLIRGFAGVRKRFGFPLAPRPRRRLLGGLCFGCDALAREVFRTLLRFETRAGELQRFAFDTHARFRVSFELEFGGFARLRGFQGARICFGARGCRLFCFAFDLRARSGIACSAAVYVASFARRGLCTLLGFEASLGKRKRFPLGQREAFSLSFGFELESFADLRFLQRARVGFGTRLRGAFRSGVGDEARLRFALQRRVGSRALVRGIERFLFRRFTRARSGFRAHLRLAVRFGFVACEHLGLRAF
jgi:hypothetical protein